MDRTRHDTTDVNPQIRRGKRDHTTPPERAPNRLITQMVGSA
jgi:hypothetical protein